MTPAPRIRRNEPASFNRLAAMILAAGLALGASTSTRADAVRLTVTPSSTDSRIGTADSPHIVLYEQGNTAGNLLLWLAGTGGKPANGPFTIYDTAVQQGYRVIGLSYVNDPAVSQVCVGRNLKSEPACAANFRKKRIYGDDATTLIGDQPQDAIVNRLVKLLQHLAESDKAGKWEQYLDNGLPRWERIAVAGQSQGGGMAAFIAKEKRVARVIMFSGGWDKRGNGEIAGWYGWNSATPANLWYATYHVEEPEAQTMAKIYRVLGIPPDNIAALDLPVKGKKPHREGINNPAYKPLWIRALGQAG